MKPKSIINLNNKLTDDKTAKLSHFRDVNVTKNL